MCVVDWSRCASVLKGYLLGEFRSNKCLNFIGYLVECNFSGSSVDPSIKGFLDRRKNRMPGVYGFCADAFNYYKELCSSDSDKYDGWYYIRFGENFIIADRNGRLEEIDGHLFYVCSKDAYSVRKSKSYSGRAFPFSFVGIGVMAQRSIGCVFDIFKAYKSKYGNNFCVVVVESKNAGYITGEDIDCSVHKDTGKIEFKVVCSDGIVDISHSFFLYGGCRLWLGDRRYVDKCNENGVSIPFLDCTIQ